MSKNSPELRYYIVEDDSSMVSNIRERLVDADVSTENIIVATTRSAADQEIDNLIKNPVLAILFLDGSLGGSSAPGADGVELQNKIDSFCLPVVTIGISLDYQSYVDEYWGKRFTTSFDFVFQRARTMLDQRALRVT